MCFSIEIDRDLKKIAKRFGAKADLDAFYQLQALAKNDPKNYKIPKEDNRVFPHYYAPVILQEKTQRIIRPMKYQLLPHFSKEDTYTRINPKTGRKNQIKTYNARLDSLEIRRAWKDIYLKNHAIIPFTKFFEYIPRKNKFEVAAFYPPEELMWSIALWDKWESNDKKEKIYSFAIITDDPPKEVAAAGHDRCPIYLKEDLIETWLAGNFQSKKELDSFVSQKEDAEFKYSFLNNI